MDPVGDSVERVAAAAAVTVAVDGLSERESAVIAHRFGLIDGEPKTLDELGLLYGVTRERIREIEARTLSKLRHPKHSADTKFYVDTPKIAPVGNRASPDGFFKAVDAIRRRERAELPHCGRCGGFLLTPGVGRPPKYCSNACRQAAYRARRKTRATMSRI